MQDTQQAGLPHQFNACVAEATVLNNADWLSTLPLTEYLSEVLGMPPGSDAQHTMMHVAR